MNRINVGGNQRNRIHVSLPPRNITPSASASAPVPVQIPAAVRIPAPITTPVTFAAIAASAITREKSSRMLPTPPNSASEISPIYEMVMTKMDNVRKDVANVHETMSNVNIRLSEVIRDLELLNASLPSQVNDMPKDIPYRIPVAQITTEKPSKVKSKKSRKKITKNTQDHQDSAQKEKTVIVVNDNINNDRADTAEADEAPFPRPNAPFPDVQDQEQQYFPQDQVQHHQRFNFSQKARHISYGILKSRVRRDVVLRDADVLRRAIVVIQAFVVTYGCKRPWNKIIVVARHNLVAECIMNLASEYDLNAEILSFENINQNLAMSKRTTAHMLIGTPDQVLYAYDKRYFFADNIKVIYFEDVQSFCNQQGGDTFKVLERMGQRQLNRRPANIRIYGVDRDETNNFVLNADNGLVLRDRRTFSLEINRGPEARANFFVEMPDEEGKFEVLVQLTLDKDNQMHIRDRCLAIFVKSIKDAHELAEKLENESSQRNLQRDITVLTPNTRPEGDIIITTDALAYILRYHPVDAVVHMCLPEPPFPGRSFDVVYKERKVVFILL